jgi:hypothetical protein
VAIAYGTGGALTRCGTATFAVLVVCACAEHEKPKAVEENAYPADYRTQVADLARRQFGGNARDAYIAEPVLKTSLPTPRYVACMRFNAGDGGGSSKGNKLYAAYFYAGKITQIADATVEQCDKAAFLPFAELR